MSEELHVGILRRALGGGQVDLDRRDLVFGRSVFVPEKYLNGAPFGMKVVVSIQNTDELSGRLKGKIVETLGDPNNPDVAIEAIIRSYNLPTDFPENVKAEAMRLPQNLSEEVVATALQQGRIDLRPNKTITIDGLDAKDLDDAVEVEYDATKQEYRLLVSIADVGEVVKSGTALDLEAFSRSNSVYLVDRVLPMLPPRLSNGLCSLNPDCDRLTLTAEIIFDRFGVVQATNVFESVIRSKVRTSYDEVKLILEGGVSEIERPEWFVETLQCMHSLYSLLLKQRELRGAINFTIVEPHVVLAEDGSPTLIEPHQVSFANGIIEEFMIAANVCVAKTALRERLPIIYRSHGEPNAKRYGEFATLAKTMGIKQRRSGSQTPFEIASLMRSIEARCNQNEIQTLSKMLLQSMAKAEYSAINEGHFGLALGAYCHFTSPIRRYSDLATHRVLKAWLRHKRNNEAFSPIQTAEKCSLNERIAMRAERDTVDQKACEYFAKRIGETYQGRVNGFANSCCFVELMGVVDGAIMFRDLPSYYTFSRERMRAFSNRAGKSIGIGDEITVTVAAVDLIKRRIDLVPVNAQKARAKTVAQAEVDQGRKRPKPIKKRKETRAARRRAPR